MRDTQTNPNTSEPALTITKGECGTYDVSLAGKRLGFVYRSGRVWSVHIWMNGGLSNRKIAEMPTRRDAAAELKIQRHYYGWSE